MKMLANLVQREALVLTYNDLLLLIGCLFVFGLMLLKSRRFIEYGPPFVLIFSALATRPMIERWTVGS